MTLYDSFINPLIQLIIPMGIIIDCGDAHIIPTQATNPNAWETQIGYAIMPFLVGYSSKSRLFLGRDLDQVVAQKKVLPVKKLLQWGGFSPFPSKTPSPQLLG